MGAHVGSWDEYTYTQLEQAIREACLGDIDEYIARRYLIGKRPHIEIAGELLTRYGVEYDRSTISHHWRKIAKKIKKRITSA